MPRSRRIIRADELPDDIDQRLDEIEAARPCWTARSLIYDPAEIARAGVFVSIDAEGLLSIGRGYVRPEDEAPGVVEPESEVQGDGETNDDGPTTNGVVQRAVITVGGAPAEPVEEDDDDTVKPLPDRLITELTAHRTLALRNALANDPAVPSRRCCTILCCDLLSLLVVERLLWKSRSGLRHSPRRHPA